MATVCSEGKCNGCMACKSACSQAAVEVKDEVQAYNAYINEEKCVHCGLCNNVCPQRRFPELKPPILWQQGWAVDETIRARSSSGGAAAALTRSFIINGGYVCSCVFSHGEFLFEITNEIEKMQAYTGSKYVKSNPTGIHKRIEDLLKAGEKVLFIGLPCQAAGLKNFIPDKLQNHLYLVDLICHGTPSPSLLRKHVRELGTDLNQIEYISFREKTGWKMTVPGLKDREAIEDTYLMGFLSGRFYTENCYDCSYAGINRVSDVTLGDSWGSDMKEELKKGLSLILCQTERGVELIQSSNIHLEPVNIDKAIASNQQLRYPYKKSEKTARFFRIYQKTKKFGLSFFSIEPKKVFKQQVKYILIRLQLYIRSPKRRGT